MRKIAIGEEDDGTATSYGLAAAQTVKDALDATPEMRLVLEMATRARKVEQMEPPKNLWINTEIVSPIGV